MTDTPAPEPETDPLDEPGDGVKLVAVGGRVLFVIDGVNYLLRPPNMGQMRSYREAYADVLESAHHEAEEAVERAQAVKDGDQEALESAAADAYERNLAELRAGMSPQQKMLVELGRCIVGDLCQTGQHLPDDDDLLPPWLANLNLYNALCASRGRTASLGRACRASSEAVERQQSPSAWRPCAGWSGTGSPARASNTPGGVPSGRETRSRSVKGQ